MKESVANAILVLLGLIFLFLLGALSKILFYIFLAGWYSVKLL